MKKKTKKTIRTINLGSGYIDFLKAVQKHTVATHTIFAGPGRIVGLYLNKEPNLAQSTVTLQDDSTDVATFKVRATDNTNGAGMTEYIQFPGTGIRCATSIKVTIASAVTFCTVIFG